MNTRPKTSLIAKLARACRGGMTGRNGGVALMFALLTPVLILLVAGVLDASFALNAKTKLQDASDEASLAVSIATGQNPNISESQLEAIAQNALDANFTDSAPTITDFHVCAPVQNDCTDGQTTMQLGTVKVTASAPTTCVFASIVPMFCVNGSNQTVGASSLTTISFGKTLQLNVVMDSSASMIVGATPADVTTISNWVSANWDLVKPGDPAPYTGQDNPPCAFACHDVGGATGPADIALGLTRANSAGATTRFDVMIAAAQALITHVQQVSTANNQNRQNSYLFNVWSFDTTLHQYGVSNIPDFPDAQTAVSQVTPGLDTYLDNAMSTLATQVGANGTGGSILSPLKFVIVVTDGLQSDRGGNWQNCSWAPDPAWSNFTDCTGGFASPINTANCQTMKNNNVILAVLETPYVPLDGQSPNVQPYEKTVRKIIYPTTTYPNGPTNPPLAGPSAISAALAACASPGYYFQAANSAQIAAGFVALTDEFLARSTVIVQ
ncbi:MAG TPA: TadE/TadG family type IV pilus assembly protein [Caulobacteraceae bacterium]